MDQLDELNVDAADLMETLNAVVGLHKIIAQAQALQARFIARFDKLRAGDEFNADELGVALTITHHAAAFRIELANQLTGRLPATLAALQRGDIDLHKATILAELAAPLSDDHATQVETRVLARAPEQTAQLFRQAVRRAIVRVDPKGAAERHKERRRDRYVELRPADDAMAWLNAYLPYEHAAAIYAAPTSLSTSC